MHNYLIKDLMNVNRGSSPRPIMEYLSDSGYRWLKISDFNLYDRYVYETKEFIKEAGLKNTRHLPAGTLILTNSATPGIPIFLGKDMCLHDGFLYFTNINENIININFLYYWFLYNRNLIINQANGSVFKNLKKDIVENFEIKVPDINIQLKIIKILDNINSKIELNNEINNNLFELLKSGFKSKFYNKKEKDLYLADFISGTIGGDWGKDNPEGNNNTKVYCVRGADIPNMEYGNKGNAPIRYILEKNYKSKKLDPNNIIIEISGGSPTQSTGRTAYITQSILDMYDSPLLCTNFCRAIETKNEILAPFVYMNLKLMYEDNIFFNWENGTTGIKNLALNDMLSNIEVKKPDEDDLKEYDLLFNSVMNKISHNSNENIKLEQLRDTLLPKLINGEIELENIEI
mgnify:CR=1 FL=1